MRSDRPHSSQSKLYHKKLPARRPTQRRRRKKKQPRMQMTHRERQSTARKGSNEPKESERWKVTGSNATEAKERD